MTIVPALQLILRELFDLWMFDRYLEFLNALIVEQLSRYARSSSSRLLLLPP